MPNFSRSSMDGYAVRAKDTFGASDSLPAFLELAGEVVMGSIPADVVTPGKAVKISTGGMIPEGRDALVMVEASQYTVILTQAGGGCHVQKSLLIPISHVLGGAGNPSP